ncbi:alpha/beta hydrolase [Inhella sp. 1Y17]|uniref:Alpha/beta hydrolase n=2 Tax=Inhella proteolytica TaxID=2795029 RepID=A0A931J1S3_9BURK|nr:alpha/beta hydrolase [Inhella proteolytica]
MRPTLVLLPGMDGTGELFEPLLQALPATQPVLVLRYPLDGPQHPAALANWVGPQLPADRPFVLLGESFSGPVAILLAAAAPPGLQGLVLCASFARKPSRLPAALAPLAKVLAQLPRPTWAVSAALLGPHATPALRERLTGALAQLPPAVLAARLQAVLHGDVRAALRQTRLPLLLLEAQHDRLVPARCQRELLALRPDAERVAFAAPHLLLQCAPQAAAQALLAFVDRLVSPCAAAQSAAR